MPRFPITENECDDIIAQPKRVRANISWVHKPNKSWVTSKVSVEGDFKGQIQLITTVNVEEPLKFSFTLLLNGAHRIRGLDVSGSHLNKCSDQQYWYGQTHKHPWTDSCPGGHAYTPTEITGTNLQEVFMQFCEECNIDFRGHFSPAPTQAQLPGI